MAATTQAHLPPPERLRPRSRDCSATLRSANPIRIVGGKSDAVYIAQVLLAVLALAVVSLATSASKPRASCKAGWDGKRHISYQQQKDLFYNYYAQPGPYNGAAAQMYVSPAAGAGERRPHLGHLPAVHAARVSCTSTNASYYTYNPGAGWRRTNVRYGTCGLRCEKTSSDLRFPMSNNIWALHNDFYYPGLRFYADDDTRARECRRTATRCRRGDRAWLAGYRRHAIHPASSSRLFTETTMNRLRLAVAGRRHDGDAAPRPTPNRRRPACGCRECDCGPPQSTIAVAVTPIAAAMVGYMRPIARADGTTGIATTRTPTTASRPRSSCRRPPNLQTNYGWGVASSRISRIDHQFQRNYPGDGTFGGPFRPTPIWPSDTTQFGVYSVRGPW